MSQLPCILIALRRRSTAAGDKQEDKVSFSDKLLIKFRQHYIFSVGLVSFQDYCVPMREKDKG
jgi:hypothetical protein